MRRLGVSLAVVSWVLIGSASADEGKQKRADELFEQGRKMLNEAGADKAKISAACDKFDEAIKLDPEAPGTMLNLGLCNEKLDKYKTALYWFRKAQARASETHLQEYEAAAKEHTVDLASKVATIKITFSGGGAAPDGTKVKIDNEEIAPADYLHAEVDPGHHSLLAGAPGRKNFTTEFDVSGRGGDTINVDLVEGTNAVIVDRGAGRRKAAIFVAAGGVVLWGVSGAISWWAKGKYDIYAQDGMAKTGQDDGGKFCKTAGGCTLDEATDGANHYQNIARWGATPIFVAGSLAVAGAIVLYVTAPDKERIDQTVFTPIVTPNDVGFAMTRRF